MILGHYLMSCDYVGGQGRSTLACAHMWFVFSFCRFTSWGGIEAASSDYMQRRRERVVSGSNVEGKNPLQRSVKVCV